MKREEFCEVLGDINENYVKEAGANPKAEKRRRFKSDYKYDLQLR